MDYQKVTVTMTDKQILTDCKPRPMYYANSYGRRLARPCLLCTKTISGTFGDLEYHALTTDIPAYEEAYTCPR